MKKMILLLLFLSAAAAFAANSYTVQLENAEESFKKGDYSKAVEIYEALSQVEKINNPFVYYNLSNAYYRNGNLGKAVLNINKAHRLAPRDKDIRANLEYLSGLAGENPYGGFAGLMLSRFSLNEITVSAAALVIIILLGFSAFLISRNSFAKKSAVAGLLILIPASAALFFRADAEILSKRAVVINASEIRSGPGINNPGVFSLPEGKIVTIASSNGGWSNIQTRFEEETLNGWIEDADIGKF
ncbi:MAG: tetratricopeptide repeat protein [Endomicrobium sp.]|jgi:tetratricopeptide (TPR) repeat protein|nr:tetratricopeptide repeat protein [Endomicrobium sp.]